MIVPNHASTSARSRFSALSLALVAVLLPACAALVSPDPSRLGGADGAGADGGSLRADTPAAVGDPLGDPRDCGASHARCGVAELCVLGACTCRPPLLSVGGACIDPLSDPNHCGPSGARCPDACREGRCDGGCGGLTECDGACVELRRDPLNCGECGNACNGRAVCIDGSCRDISPARGCTSCPCAACDAACCTLNGLGLTYCVDADGCPR
jgi:hypothetical protein